MPRYRNGVTNDRYSLLFRPLRKATSSRSRRIILANLVLLLFLTALWLAHRGRTKVIVPTENISNVYYVSKRALCSRSIAHEQLGIQPIAVSKVILRPTLQREGAEAYDGRLEVLESPMINDVVFLDRNVSGKEAELSAN